MTKSEKKLKRSDYEKTASPKPPQNTAACS